VTNCSNNYGPFQYPEKLVPVMILNMLEGKALPVYGDGRWKQSVTFEDGLRKTVRWYLDNPAWIDHVRSGERRNWIEANYTKR